MQRYPQFEEALGQEITKAREAKNISRRGLSSLLRRSSNYMSLIESGKQELTVSGLSEIGLALGLKGSELHARAERAAGLRLPKSK